MVGMDELAACLRSWRDRLSPAEAGLPAGTNRRAPGLRREEVAQLAGLSVDYLARLEQGRAANPSPSVLAPLARALRLSDAERDHLFRVAGHAEPSTGRMNRHLTPGVQRVLDRLADVPVVVVDAGYDLVAWTPPAAALIGDPSPWPQRERNIAWRHFAGCSDRIVRTREEIYAFEVAVAADLHAAVARYPQDGRLLELVADLRAMSTCFASLWETRPVASMPSRRKTFRHPAVGDVTVDCDHLSVEGSDLKIVVYTAPPGSEDAERLELVAALGLQSFAT
jgi:transcriptional regulator with XRE-family HTH domain